MNHSTLPAWSACLPLRLIEARFGSGNVDDAGDELAGLVSALATWPEQYRCRFDFDTVHSNPWFHVLIIEVDGLNGAPALAFHRQLLDLELIEPD